MQLTRRDQVREHIFFITERPRIAKEELNQLH